ncbi:MAG: RHS repeat-associated core domain-containing protein, partial [Negativicutes bacterium]|nr:RHS repeat-associated core domain-containing protein [Negativicutes bacterium]
QADGNLTSASDPTGNGIYAFDTAGILTSRTVGNRQTSIASRDGEGRPLSIATSVNLATKLSESLTWSGDGLLTTHALNRVGDFTDSRSYSYASLSRRLTQEQLNLNATTTWTNTFVYDNSVPAGPGALTSAGSGSALWNGGLDAFSRIVTATNNLIPYAAYGHVNGQSTLSAWLDNQPVSVTGVGTNAMEWRASMELAQGQHQLLVAAAHPSGQFTAWATNSFTNSLANQTVNDSFDSAGNITNRVWTNPSGTVERIQTLSWDARGRLHAVTERDANTNGYNWTAVYDGLNRRLSTTSVLVTNGVVYAAPPTTINSYFDPQVEFLELGVSYGKTTEWKLYGPDLNGKYGGLNGTGGFEAVSPYLNLFEPTISDFRGNILGVVTNSTVQWNPARPTGFGAAPNYRPVALGNGASIALSSAWRGRWADITGYHSIGARTYDPVSGRWLSFDPTWNASDPNGMSFCGGDPINSFDCDGRFARGFYAAKYQEDYMPADASSAFETGDYFGSALRGASQGLSQGIDTLWNTAYLTFGRPEGATPQMDQNFLNSDLASPMQNWFNVAYGDNSSGNSLAATYGPLMQNSVNSFGVGERTATSPDFQFEQQPVTVSEYQSWTPDNGFQLAPLNSQWTRPGTVPQLQQQQAQYDSTMYEHPDATTLSQEEMDYLNLHVSDAGVYINQHQNGTYIGEYGSGQGRAEISVGDKESLYSDPIVHQQIFPVPTKIDAQLFEAELIDEVGAVSNPNYYNKKSGNKNAGN